MNRPPLACRAAHAAMLLVLASASSVAQPVTKAPPRLPPNASETARIPTGVDTGSPATSQTVPLGTPVPPALGADRNEIKTRSAAARAAARPKLGASGADCARTVAGDSAAAAGAAASVPSRRIAAAGAGASASTSTSTKATRSGAVPC